MTRLTEIRYRIRAAWAVLTGRATAMTGTYWTSTQTTSDPGHFRWDVFL